MQDSKDMMLWSHFVSMCAMCAGEWGEKERDVREMWERREREIWDTRE